ncbi:Melanoma Antigen Preferentially Expressed In Tumors, partial [Manis pentadactyla]
FKKMDKKTTGTLLELAAKSLLSNEQAAIHALDELPRDLFVPLFIPAFLGRHKEILKAMLDSLQELDLSTLYIRNRLHRLLRVLPPQLKALNLSFCGLSSKDITILSQSSLATHLRQLNLSHNQIFSEAHEPFQTLLERASALSHCSCLCVLSFAFNRITMPVLISLLQHLTSLMELKHVIYPMPVHCYRQWDVPDNLDQQQLAEVQGQLKAVLQAVQWDDMHWTFHTAVLPCYKELCQH